MKDYKQKSFFKLALNFGGIFLIVITLIKIFMAIFKTGSFQSMMDEYFLEGAWKQFVKIQVVISAIYGLFMAGYYKFIKK